MPTRSSSVPNTRIRTTGRRTFGSEPNKPFLPRAEAQPRARAQPSAHLPSHRTKVVCIHAPGGTQTTSGRLLGHNETPRHCSRGVWALVSASAPPAEVWLAARAAAGRAGTLAPATGSAVLGSFRRPALAAGSTLALLRRRALGLSSCRTSGPARLPEPVDSLPVNRPGSGSSSVKPPVVSVMPYTWRSTAEGRRGVSPFGLADRRAAVDHGPQRRERAGHRADLPPGLRGSTARGTRASRPPSAISRANVAGRASSASTVVAPAVSPTSAQADRPDVEQRCGQQAHARLVQPPAVHHPAHLRCDVALGEQDPFGRPLVPDV